MKFGPANVGQQVWNRRDRDVAVLVDLQKDGRLCFRVRDGYRSWTPEEADATFAAFPDGWRVEYGRPYRPATADELEAL